MERQRSARHRIELDEGLRQRRSDLQAEQRFNLESREITVFGQEPDEEAASVGIDAFGLNGCEGTPLVEPRCVRRRRKTATEAIRVDGGRAELYPQGRGLRDVGECEHGEQFAHSWRHGLAMLAGWGSANQ